MPTHIFNKKAFINFIEKEISADTAIVFTGEVTGNLTASKNGVRITHLFAPDAFKDEGVGHIAFGETSTLGVFFMDKKRLSDKGLKILNEQNP